MKLVHFPPPEAVIMFSICRPTGEIWQSKTLFLTNFDLRSSIVFTFSIAAYPVCIQHDELRIQTERDSKNNEFSEALTEL